MRAAPRLSRAHRAAAKATSPDCTTRSPDPREAPPPWSTSCRPTRDLTRKLGRRRGGRPGPRDRIAEAYIPPAQGAVAIGFAIHAATAVDVAEPLLKSGHVEHAFLGIQPAKLTPQLAQRLGIRTSSGVLVYAVTPGSPADQAHIKPGDVLVKLAGKPVMIVEELFAVLREHCPGQTVPIELARGDQHKTVHVKLSAKPQ